MGRGCGDAVYSEPGQPGSDWRTSRTSPNGNKSNQIKFMLQHIHMYKVIFTLNKHVTFYIYDARFCLAMWDRLSAAPSNNLNYIHGDGMTRWEQE